MKLAVTRSSLDRIGVAVASLWPPYRRRKRREAMAAERAARNEAELQRMLFRALFNSLKVQLGKSLGRPAELQDIVEMDVVSLAAITAGTEEKRTEMIVAAYFKWGIAYDDYLKLAMPLAPEQYESVLLESERIVTSWGQGFPVTRRADEPEACARYWLDVMEREPKLARITAGAVLKLPPGNPLRDEARVRKTLEGLLASALGAVGKPEADDETMRSQTTSALLAISGLIEHELVGSPRLDSLLEAGTRLLESPHLNEDGRPFRLAMAKYLINEAGKARAGGEPEFARQLDARASSLLKPIMNDDDNPIRRNVMSLIQAHLEGRPNDGAMEELAASPRNSAQGSQANRVGTSILARRAYEARDDDRVIQHLAPVLGPLQERYLSAVLDEDVAAAGRELADALRQFAFASRRRGDIDGCLEALDRMKSLRFRYQSLLRRSPLGFMLRDLEADIHAVSRGLKPQDAQLGMVSRQSSLAELLEVYRQAREKVGSRDLDQPGLDELRAVLDRNEGAVVLGMDSSGTLLAPIRGGDVEPPHLDSIVPPEDAREMLASLIDPGKGWMTGMEFGHDADQQRAALVRMLRVVDRILGRPIADAFRESGVRRITIIPHELLHMIPFWALPSLASFEVAIMPSVAQLVAARRARVRLEPRALVVGNPTGDLDLAATEARHVKRLLEAAGCSCRAFIGSDATEDALSTGMRDATVLHFSGHGRSDLTRPTCSALEVCPAIPTETEQGADLLVSLASAAEWKGVQRLAGTEWVVCPTEHTADVSPHGRLERHILSSSRRVELRLEHGERGTLLGQYAIADAERDEAFYGERLRLSELWMAGDIMIEGSFAECRLAFLSSCEAGAGSLSLVDEFAGLPAALQLAGVSTVIAPLWPVGVELAAVFCEEFYRAMIAAQGNVDVLALVHRIRHQVRTMTRVEAAAVFDRMRAAVDDPLEGLLLESASQRLAQTSEEHPFQHPYHWAAFQLTGSPVLEVVWPAGTRAAETLESAPADGFELPVTPDETLDLRPLPDVFEAAQHAETLAAASDDPALHRILAKYLYERALAHRRAGQGELADRDFARTVELDPSHADAHLALAHSSVAHRDFEDASLHSDRALEILPNHPTVLLTSALIHEARGQVQQARDECDTIVALSPSEPVLMQALIARARLRMGAGDSEGCISDLSEAIGLRPEDVSSYLIRAEAHRAREHWDGARSDARCALFLGPRMAESWHGHALSLLRQEHISSMPVAGMSTAEPSTRENPSSADPDAAGRRARHLSEALVNLTRAIELDPRPEYRLDRGLTLSSIGEHARAVDDYEAILGLDPDHVAARYNRACAQSQMGVPGSIVEDLHFAIASDPSLAATARADPDLDWARRHLRELDSVIGMTPGRSCLT